MSNLSGFKPQRKNTNKHTQKGLRELENSIQRDGWIGGITVAADGETFDGSARLETLANVMPDVEPIIVKTDGHKPVIIMRTDIESADDPRAKRLAVGANVIHRLDFEPDIDLLAELANEDSAIADLLKQDAELADLLGIEPTVGEWADAFDKLPDGERAPFQQITFTLHDSQAEQVKEALKASKGMGAFVDSPNENSNGNAIARICETFLTEHANG